MEINYWDCKFNFYDDYYDEESDQEYRLYLCSHPKNNDYGCCDLDNKYNDDEEDCILLDTLL